MSKMAFSAFQLPSLPSGLSGGHLVGAPWAPPAEVLKSRLDLGGVFFLSVFGKSPNKMEGKKGVCLYTLW